MATDPDPVDPEEPDDDDDDGDTVEVDREELRGMIRDELRGVIEEFRGGGSGGGGSDDDAGDDAPVTVKGIESAVEAAMTKAMGELSRKAPTKKAAPKKKAPDPEPAPIDPPRSRVAKLLENAWK